MIPDVSSEPTDIGSSNVRMRVPLSRLKSKSSSSGGTISGANWSTILPGTALSIGTNRFPDMSIMAFAVALM